MINLDLTNLHKVAAEHGLSKSEIQEQAAKIPEYLEKIHARKQGFYKIVDDEDTIQKVIDFATRARGKYDHIIVLGIGGSSLGAICLQQSLTHIFSTEQNTSTPQLHVIDNIDPVFIKELEDVIDYKKTLFIAITKSGTTPETVSQYEYFKGKGGNLVFITDPEKGKLREIAKKKLTPAFDIPQDVGGRFSVLTPVGLLPAALIDIDIRRLMTAAKEMRNAFLSENFDTNLPFQIAAIQYLLAKKGKIMNVMMPYSQKLVRFADWYRQLLAESIGKAKDNDGKTVNVGITPIKALGVTDQHSQSQLYMEGPNDKLIMFIKVARHKYQIEPFTKLMDVEQRATADALAKNDRPNLTIEIPAVNEDTLGTLFMLFEAATAFLGEFFEINAFDQPGVELSKILTKKYLG